MANKMLIDASHPEETRVVVLRGNRVEEFDFEAASRKQLRGNIYLAKVTRVEPSLQAAFVEYGGNRHGFLAFAEIHPDYYQIPVADRQALLDEEARAHSDEDDEERGGQRHSRRNRNASDGGDTAAKRRAADDQIVSEAAEDHAAAEPAGDNEPAQEAETDHAPPRAPETAGGYQPSYESEAAANHVAAEAAEAGPESTDAPEDGDVQPEAGAAEAQPAGEREPRHRDGNRRRGRGSRNGGKGGPRPARTGGEDAHEDGERESVEQMGGDAMEEMSYRAPRLRRQYKIQEVIKRRQVLLIQVVKEERGNKGAALTTYLSLAGRYSVLMPNTARGGGISRKITDSADRKRLKTIAQDLEVPDGMGVILRTAGASRTKAEVKRDFEYLMRMWETVRELTLRSSAPTLVYEEGSLIKRSIRDLYNKDIDEVLVAGDDGYREAKEFMRMLMPSHAKNVKPYKDPQAIFAKSGAEAQLDAMFSNQVVLKSGGYIVINQTEALVAIDVNSGRSTREHNIEDTALRTNLEAADEVARQLRLRDLAGLIVVDFIDMDENRNNRAIEKRMKDALENDRARIQVGRISHFGLLEMSRQRIRTGVLEGSTVACPHCAGAGMVRATSSIALHVMRVLEEALIKNAAFNPIVRARTEVALYILNQKRANLRELETRFGVNIMVLADETLTGTVYHALERGEPVTQPLEDAARPEAVRSEPVRPSESFIAEEEEEEAEIEAEVEEKREERPRREGRRERGDNRDRQEGERAARSERGPRPEAGPQAERSGDDSEVARKRRRRRRRRGGSDRDNVQSFAPDAPQPFDDGHNVMAEADGFAPVVPEADLAQTDERRDMAGDAPVAESAAEAPAPRARRGGRSRKVAEPLAEAGTASEATPAEPAADAPRRSRRAPKAKVAAESAVAAETPAPVAEPAPVAGIASEPVAEVAAPKPDPLPEAVAGPKRSGWWSRAKATLTGQ